MDAATDFSTRLDALLGRASRRRRGLGPPQVAVSAPTLGIDYRSGDRDRRFHAASAGKLFTATLVMQLVEDGRLTVDTPVADLLAADEIAGLFAADARTPATVHHLLANTSGAADYFEGEVIAGRPVRDLVLAEPDRTWTPADLLDFARRNQRPVGAPGERFVYSDTGWLLLGRILEELTGRSYHELLHERIFTPLGMRDSALLFRSIPENDRAVVGSTGRATGSSSGTGRATIASTADDLRIAPFRLGRVEASRFQSLSLAWSDGGAVSTPDDLVVFSRALHDGRLLSPASLSYLAEPRNRYRRGIRYGAGTMEMRFGEFSPVLRRLPRPIGHLGVFATHVLHDPEHDAEIVLNFAATGEMARSFRTLIRIEQELRRAAG